MKFYKRNFTYLAFCFLIITHFNFAGTVKGTVIDKTTNKPLIGVNISVLKTFKGTTTDTKGNFRITLSNGYYSLRFSIVGYNSVIKNIKVDNDNIIKLSIYLTQIPYKLKGVVVKAQRDKNFIVANYELNERSIKNVPAFVESDVMRAIAVLPGIANYNDFKGAVSIRGSSPDQTQILYDDMEVYYPWHLFGSLGTFNIQAIDNVQVFTGGFPSEYGNRSGGIIDIKSKKFNGEKIFNINISLLTSSILYNNKFGNFELLVTGRKTYLDILSQFFYRIPYGYVDANLKLRYLLNRYWKFELLGYANNDFFTASLDNLKNKDIKFNLSDFFKSFFKGKLNWGNRNIGFKTEYKTQDFSANLLFYNSLFSMDFPKLIVNKLNDYTTKLDMTYLFSPKILFKLGIENKFINTNYKWKYNDNDLLEIYPAGKTPVNKNSNKNITAFYSSVNWINHNLELKSGLRLTLFNGSIFSDPRLSFKYNVKENNNYFSTFGKYTQFLVSPFENNEFTIGNPFVFAQNPLTVYNFSIGTEQALSKLINAKLEFYYKNMNRLPLDINNTLKDIQTGKAKAFGIDLFLHKNVGYFTWQLSYSFIKTAGSFNEVTFPLDWEITHNLSLLTGFNFSNNWYSNIGLSYHTGLPYTPVISSFYGISNHTGGYGNNFIFGERNSKTYPNYLRLDFSLSKKYSWKSLDLVLNLRIINFLYRSNILKVDWGSYYFSTPYYNSEGNEIRAGVTKGIPILPSVGIELHFK